MSRDFKTINIAKFNADLGKSLSKSDINITADLWNDNVSRVVDEHAPIIKRTVTKRPCVPWYSTEVKNAKSMCQKFERQYQK